MNIQDTIKNKLAVLQPQVCIVENESDKHNVPPGSESHFKVTIVSDQFTDKSLLARQRLINQILQTELQTKIHALAMYTLSPSEWKNKLDNNMDIAPSPPCMGGSAAKSK